MRRTVVMLAIGFVLLWNSGFIGAEYGLQYAGPFTLLFWRYLALTAFLFLYLLVRKRFRWVGWATATPHMVVGVLAHGAWLLCVMLAINRKVPAGIVALVVALQPLATGAFSGLVTGEHTSLYRWLGLITGFGGVVLVVGIRIDSSESVALFKYLIPLGSVVAITSASLLQRRMHVRNSQHRLPLDLTLFYQCLATAAVFALPAIILENAHAQWNAEFVYTLTWLILGVSLGSYAFMWLLIERISATRVASLFYLGPPVTMIMAWVSFGDVPRLMDLVGILVVVTGVFLTQLSTRHWKRKALQN